MADCLVRDSYMLPGSRTRTVRPSVLPNAPWRACRPRMELAESFEITRSLPHGHVAAVLGTARARQGIGGADRPGAVAAARSGVPRCWWPR